MFENLLSLAIALAGISLHYYVAGSIFPIIFIIAGALFLTLEIFFIPGFGVLGIIGFGILSYGVYLRLEVVPILVSVATALPLCFLMAIYIPSSRFFKSLTLTASISPSAGYIGTNQAIESLEGRTGEALTDLNPAGKIEIGEKTYTALSRGEFIAKGSAVRVVSTDCNSVVVEIVK